MDNLAPTQEGYEIEFVGEIANMVALAATGGPGNKTAAPGGAAVPDRFRSSVKVVAGAGFVQGPTDIQLKKAV